MVQGRKAQMTTAETNQLKIQGSNRFTILRVMKCQEPTIAITTMEHVPTETKEPVKEKHTPVTIKSEHITLGYLGKDGYYHETKEEALAATSLETRAQLLINDTIERAKDNATEARRAVNENVK